MNILSSAVGRYDVLGTPADADCVIGNSFGTETNPGSVNYALADYILRHADGRPIVADRTLADAFHEAKDLVDHIVEGPISDIRARGVGTWGTLAEAKSFMDDEGLEAPLLVAQAHHIGRTTMQALKLGLKPIVPGGLPNQFDRHSKQVWTKHAAIWVPFEVVGSALLKHRGQL